MIRLWGCLTLAGLLLAGCSFKPGGSSGSDPGIDAGGGFSDGLPDPDGGPGVPDGAPVVAPDSAPVEPVLLETMTIPATGEVIESDTLLAVQASYRLVASGTVSSRDEVWYCDADFYWHEDAPGALGNSFNGVDLGLAVNDTSVDENRSPDWGPFSADHIYEITMVGTGAVITAQFHDPDFGNNSGQMTLEIWGPP